MNTLAIIIYVVLAFIFGFNWPLRMLCEGGIIGIVITLAWAAMFVA